MIVLKPLQESENWKNVQAYYIIFCQLQFVLHTNATFLQVEGIFYAVWICNSLVNGP